jgi:hypothetical protein
MSCDKKNPTLDPHGSMVRDPPENSEISWSVRNLLQGKGLQALLGAFDAWRNLFCRRAFLTLLFGRQVTLYRSS